MSNTIAPGSSADVNVKVTALTTNPNVPVTYKTIILKKNLVNGVNTLMQDMVSTANAKYVIKYDYMLGEDITIPENCILEFDGGSISGAFTITGNNTRIDYIGTIFKDIKIEGSFIVPVIKSSMFSDIYEENRIIQLFNLCNPNIHNSVYINIGTYLVSVETNASSVIVPVSNTTVYNDGTIQLLPNPFKKYYIVNIKECDNVVFVGGKIRGDVDTHTGEEGEWGMGINITDNASNIVVENVEVTHCWGDGVYIGDASNIQLNNFSISNCRRQGISITAGTNIFIKNGKFSEIEGTNPQACIDIEPNREDECKNISIINCVGTGNRVGLLMYGDAGKIENVTIKNCVFSTSKSLSISSAKYITIESSYFYNSIYIIGDSRFVTFASCLLEFTNLVINSSFHICFINCDIRSSVQDLTIPKTCYLQSCYLHTRGTIINLYCDNTSCRINTNTSVKIYNTNSNNLEIIRVKGSSGDYIINLYNSIVSKLLLTVIDSEDSFTPYCYIYADQSKIFEITIDSEVIPNGLIYGGTGANEIYNISFVKNEGEVKYNVLGGTAKVFPSEFRSKGTTEQRPSVNAGYGTGLKGFEYFDTTLGKPIYWNGITWVDALGNLVDSVYPKVIGNPTNGNLAKFNNKNIEDAGVAPQV